MEDDTKVMVLFNDFLNLDSLIINKEGEKSRRKVVILKCSIFTVEPICKQLVRKSFGEIFTI